MLFERGEQAIDAPASEAAFAILHALYWLVVRLAERAPLLLVVDDAQWVDEPSLRFLVYLLGRLSGQPVAVLVGARAGRAARPDCSTDSASDPAVRVWALAPLGEAAVSRLVHARLPEADEGFCRRCFELTVGNPLAAARAAGGDRAAAAPG